MNFRQNTQCFVENLSSVPFKILKLFKKLWMTTNPYWNFLVQNKMYHNIWKFLKDSRYSMILTFFYQCTTQISVYSAQYITKGSKASSIFTILQGITKNIKTIEFCSFLIFPLISEQKFNAILESLCELSLVNPCLDA